MREGTEPVKKRRDCPALRVYVFPEEAASIKENAARTGMSTAAYLRNLGLSRDVSGTAALALDICQLNSELERIRTLLEELIGSDQTKTGFGRQVNGVLVDMREVQVALLLAAERLS
jgi:hypothetical protein